MICLFVFKSMSIFPACMYRKYSVHAWYLQSPEEGIRFLETRVTDGCQPPSVSLDWTGPLDSQEALLTIEVSLCPYMMPFNSGVSLRIVFLMASVGVSGVLKSAVITELQLMCLHVQ